MYLLKRAQMGDGEFHMDPDLPPPIFEEKKISKRKGKESTMQQNYLKRGI